MELAFDLVVADPPIVEIRLGKSLVASAIRQGVDVYFDCLIKANPSPKTKIVTWLHNVSTDNKANFQSLLGRIYYALVGEKVCSECVFNYEKVSEGFTVI